MGAGILLGPAGALASLGIGLLPQMSKPSAPVPDIADVHIDGESDSEAYESSSSSNGDDSDSDGDDSGTGT